jgi:hypothetical protein
MSFRSTRTAFLRPAGGRPPDRPTDRSQPLALHALSRPFRDMSPQPRIAASKPPAEAGFRAFAQCFLSWAFVPYDTCRTGILLVAAGPPATACRVRGLVTSLATLTTDPPDAEAPERPWALPSKAFSSYARGAPFGVLTLLTLSRPAAAFPRERAPTLDRLQGLVPATSSCCRQVAETA